MKQLIQKIGLLLIALFVAAPAFAADYDFEVDGIYYKVISTSELTCGVVKGDQKYSGDVVIPETVDYKNRSLKVVEIGFSAFSSHEITSVTIPNSMIYIGDRAFHGCSSLTSVVIPNSVTYIGERAFEDCSSLTSVVIPNSVTYIGESAFEDCRSLTSVEISNSVTKIKEKTFYGCSSLTSVVIPNSVTEIGIQAFAFCSSLASVGISNSLTKIGGGSFAGCNSLTSVEIPNSVTTIGPRAFSDCSSLSFIKLSENLRDIDCGTFEDCTSLESLTIPGLVESISQFSARYSGSNIIDNQTFYNCPNLKTFRFEYGKESLKPSFTYDNDDWIYDNDNWIYTIDSWENWTWRLEDIFLDRRLEPSIHPDSLRTLTIGEHIDQVDISYIHYCSELETITCYGFVPPKIGPFTAKQYMDIVVRVPNEALEAYRKAEGWREFWNLEGFDTTTGADEIHVVTEKSEIARYNLLGTPVSEDYKGIVLVRYSDGSTKKIMNK